MINCVLFGIGFELNCAFLLLLIGPLNEWWFSGFDGVESDYASYLLQTAYPTYRNHFENLHRKMLITKCIIECISANPFCSFEEMLLAVQQQYDQFDHELFLGSIHFITRQIASYDQYCDQDEIRLCDTSVYETLLKLSGASVIADHTDKPAHQGMKCLEQKSKFIKRFNTPTSDKIFNCMFNDILKNTQNISTNMLASSNILVSLPINVIIIH